MPGWQSYTYEHFELAFKAANRSNTEPKEAIVTIFLSFAWIESLVNHIIYSENISFNEIINLEDSEKKKIFPINLKPSILIDLDLETSSINEKLNKIHILIDKTKCPWGMEIFQSFDCLRKIRNALIHTKPQPQEQGKVNHPKFLQYLITKKLIIDPEDKPYNWIDLICDKNIAAWSLKTAKEVIEHFAKTSTVDNFQIKTYLDHELRIISKYKWL